jgi:hypothetical protein
MSYKTLQSLRERMWQVVSSGRQPDAPPLPNNVYFSHASKILQKMSNNGIVTHEQEAKYWLTRDDCYYMIQDDMAHACLTDRNMIEVLGDHLIWCFGLSTGVRPMSLMRTQPLEGGDSEAKLLKNIGVSPLCWGDITITRDTESKTDSEINRFIVLLRFRMLKGHVDQAGARGHSLTQIVKSTSDVEPFAATSPNWRCHTPRTIGGPHYRRIGPSRYGSHSTLCDLSQHARTSLSSLVGLPRRTGTKK